MFIRSATWAAGPRTSTGLPDVRRDAPRSMTVTDQPFRAIQYASVQPAIPAPEIRTVHSATPLGMVPVGGHVCLRQC